MDAAETNRILIDRFPEVCSYLLPNGKVEGNHFVVGGLDGSAGKSLQITLSGVAAGRFKDFATGDGGATPLWLWKAVKGISYTSAVKEAKAWLGVKDEDFGIKKHKAKEWTPPLASDRNGIQLAEPNSKVMDYLTLERKIDPIVIAKARLGETKDGEWIVIPYFDPGEREAFHIKRLKVDRTDGKKEMFASRGTKRSLYGKHLIDENAAELVITEGELDALSFHSWGIPAVSIPNGTSDDVWMNLDWEWLERFEKIYVCTDMDEPGRLVAPEICKRLGLHRCYIVSLPKKDANECLVSGITRDEIQKCLAAGKGIELDEIKKPAEYAEEVKALNRADWNSMGFSTPWFPHIPWRVRKSEFTILTGFSGHGKTPMLNHLMIDLVSQGARVMDASLEVKPAMTLYDMALAAMAKDRMNDEEVDACVSWLNESMFFLDCIGTVNIKRLLHAMEYARKRHGIDVFVIDSLFKCGLDPNDFGAQREFADLLTTFCNNSGAHVILVAHTRKMQNGNEYSVPSKADVAGSSDLVNAAFNVLVVWRNLLKELKLDEARQSFAPDLEEIDKWMSQPDNRFVLEKQKFAKGKTASKFMYFSPESNQFHSSRGRKVPYFTLSER